MATAKDLLRFLRAQGFVEKRQSGSHLVLQNPQNGYRAVIPMHPRDIPKGLFYRILKDAGFTIEDFRKY